MSYALHTSLVVTPVSLSDCAGSPLTRAGESGSTMARSSMELRVQKRACPDMQTVSLFWPTRRIILSAPNTHRAAELQVATVGDGTHLLWVPDTGALSLQQAMTVCLCYCCSG